MRAHSARATLLIILWKLMEGSLPKVLAPHTPEIMNAVTGERLFLLRTPLPLNQSQYGPHAPSKRRAAFILNHVIQNHRSSPVNVLAIFRMS